MFDRGEESEVMKYRTFFGNCATLLLSILTLNVTGKLVTAQEVKFSQLSTQAADLKIDDRLLAQTEIDLEKFCQNYPYNSQCVDRIAPDKDSPIDRERETTSTETKSSGWAIAPEASTLGLGASVVRKIVPAVNARVGVNGFSLGRDIEDTDINYEGDLNLFNVTTGLDFYPFPRSGFHLSGGLVFGNNDIDATATNNDTLELGGQTFTAEQLGTVDAEVEITQDIAPFLGIGWGNPVRDGKGLGFWLNAGVVFGGSPEVTVTPNPAVNVPNELQDELDRAAREEEEDIEDDLGLIDVYPVLSLGFSYQF
jgi:hypothetical protein